MLEKREKPVDTRTNLIKILSISEIDQLFQCLRRSGSSIDQKPYLQTDLWFESLGYYAENHTVITEDGYKLTIFRVMRQNPLPTKKRPVIFLNHGLSGSSNQWIVQEGKNNFAQALADRGYDVWLGNCRGNSYSNIHLKYNPSDYQFWDFSWHEMGIYDIPATIDKILSVTKKPSLNYISYSMGSTQYMVMLSQKPQYNAKIRKAFLLAPPGIIKDATSPIREASVLDLGKGEKYLKNFLVGGQVGSHTNFLNYLQGSSGLSLDRTCSSYSLFNCGLCANLMFYLAGFNSHNINYTAIPSFYKNYADTVSTKSLVHYAQLMNDNEGRFRMFDYGEFKNKIKYGNPNPPTYNLKKITVPTYLYYGRGDNIVPPENVEELAKQFYPGVIKEMNIIDPYDPTNMFNHIDFIMSLHAYQYFIKPIINVLSKDYNITTTRSRFAINTFI